MSPISKFHGPAETTGVTSAALPVRNICWKSASSSGQIARSTTSMPRFLASSITVWRVSPLRKQSGDGVWRTPSFTKRSEEHTSELQSLMRISYAVFCLKKKKKKKQQTHNKHKINAH